LLTYNDLKKCASLAREARNIRESLEFIQSLAEFGRMPGDRIGGDGLPLDDRPGEGATALCDVFARGHGNIQKYLTHVQCVEQAIGELGSPDQRDILRLRYVDGLKWDDVAERAHYSRAQCYNIHNAAVKALGIEDWMELDGSPVL